MIFVGNQVLRIDLLTSLKLYKGSMKMVLNLLWHVPQGWPCNNYVVIV